MADLVNVAGTTEMPPGGTRAVELNGEAVALPTTDPIATHCPTIAP